MKKKRAAAPRPPRVLARVLAEQAELVSVRGGACTLKIFQSESGRTDVTNLEGDNDGCS